MEFDSETLDVLVAIVIVVVFILTYISFYLYVKPISYVERHSNDGYEDDFTVAVAFKHPVTGNGCNYILLGNEDEIDELTFQLNEYAESLQGEMTLYNNQGIRPRYEITTTAITTARYEFQSKLDAGQWIVLRRV